MDGTGLAYFKFMNQVLSLLSSSPLNLLTGVALLLCGWFIKSAISLFSNHLTSMNSKLDKHREEIMGHQSSMLQLSREIITSKNEIKEEVEALKTALGELDRAIMKYAITTDNIAAQQEKASLDLTGLFGRILKIEEAGPLTVKPLNERELVIRATEKIRHLKEENEALKKRAK